MRRVRRRRVIRSVAGRVRQRPVAAAVGARAVAAVHLGILLLRDQVGRRRAAPTADVLEQEGALLDDDQQRLEVVRHPHERHDARPVRARKPAQHAQRGARRDSAHVGRQHVLVVLVDVIEPPPAHRLRVRPQVRLTEDAEELAGEGPQADGTVDAGRHDQLAAVVAEVVDAVDAVGVRPIGEQEVRLAGPARRHAGEDGGQLADSFDDVEPVQEGGEGLPAAGAGLVLGHRAAAAVRRVVTDVPHLDVAARVARHE